MSQTMGTDPVDGEAGFRQIAGILRRSAGIALPGSKRPLVRAWRATLAQMVPFRPLNLAAPRPLKGPFDVIFCRNAAIYSRPIQERIWTGLARLPAPAGHLFIGHPERPTGAAEWLAPVGITACRRSDCTKGPAQCH